MTPVETRRELSPSSRPSGAADRLRVALCLATLGMLVLSWPLWIETEVFPRVPFVARWPELPAGASWAPFAAALGAIAAAALGIAWRGMLGLSFVLLTLLVLQDQHRFQPWTFQYLMVGLILATLPLARGLNYSLGGRKSPTIP